MKNTKVYLFVFSFFIFSNSIAQKNNDVKLGFNISASMIKLYGNDFINKYHKPTNSFTIGTSAEIKLSSLLSFYTGLSYEKKGSVIKGDFTFENPIPFTETKKVSIIYNYITLPIILKTSLGKKRNFYLNTGTYLGYLLSQKIKKVASGDVPTRNDTNLNKKMDFGLAYGFGYTKAVGSNKTLNIELRNNLGLINTSKVFVVNDGKIKTNAFLLLMEYSFNISKKGKK